MNRWLLLLVVGCTPASPPPPTVATVEAPTSTSTSTSTATATATATATPSLDAASCARNPDPALAQCKWTSALVAACSGVVPPRGGRTPAPTPTCVCNGCLGDGDCSAKPGGKCESFSSVCSASAKACIYPGDLCANEGAACAKSPPPRSNPMTPMACAHDGHGHAVCGPMQSPPP